MKKSEQQQLDQMFEIIANLYNRTCEICGISYDKLNKKGKRKAFAVHHRFYRKDEKTYEDFRESKGKPYDKLAYYTYLLPIIINHPEWFRFIHHTHHYVSEKWARYKPANFERMVELARETNRIKYNYV